MFAVAELLVRFRIVKPPDACLRFQVGARLEAHRPGALGHSRIEAGVAAAAEGQVHASLAVERKAVIRRTDQPADNGLRLPGRYQRVALQRDPVNTRTRCGIEGALVDADGGAAIDGAEVLRLRDRVAGAKPQRDDAGRGLVARMRGGHIDITVVADGQVTDVPQPLGNHCRVKARGQHQAVRLGCGRGTGSKAKGESGNNKLPDHHLGNPLTMRRHRAQHHTPGQVASLLNIDWCAVAFCVFFLRRCMQTLCVKSNRTKCPALHKSCA